MRTNTATIVDDKAYAARAREIGEQVHRVFEKAGIGYKEIEQITREVRKERRARTRSNPHNR